MSAIFTAARSRERQRVLENAHAYFSAEAETLGIVASRYYNVDNEVRGHTGAQPEPLFLWVGWHEGSFHPMFIYVEMVTYRYKFRMCRMMMMH